MQEAEEWYENYDCQMQTGILGKIFRFSHIMMESRWQGHTFDNVLELGATNYTHLEYVKHKFKLYQVTDIKEYSIFKNKVAHLKNLHYEGLSEKNVIFKVVDAQDLQSFESNSIDRLIVTCLILHLRDFEKALMEWRRVVKKNGVITFYVHSEPGFLLRFSRCVGALFSRKRNARQHLKFVYSEHRNHYLSIKNAVNSIFDTDEISIQTFPFGYLSWNFSLWKIYQIRKS